MNLDALVRLFIFATGAAVGSFLNVVIDRTPSGRRLAGRSIADCCQRQLQWPDLIPILSFLFSLGRCRYCQKPISFYYPVVETLTALTTWLIVVAARDQTWASTLYQLINFYFLIVFFFIDLKYGLVPVSLFFLNLTFTSLFQILFYLTAKTGLTYLINTTTAATFFSLFFLTLIWLTRGRGMGLGDVLLVFLFSLFVGFPNSLVMIFLSFVIGGLFSLLALATGAKKLGQTLPFGPFLSLGSTIAFFSGQPLINLYLSKLVP